MKIEIAGKAVTMRVQIDPVTAVDKWNGAALVCTEDASCDNLTQEEFMEVASTKSGALQSIVQQLTTEQQMAEIALMFLHNRFDNLGKAIAATEDARLKADAQEVKHEG